ncbi:transposase [Methanocaldococcus sp. 28A]
MGFTINDLEINPSNIAVLTDREFKDFEIIKIFEKYGCNYISFIPKNDKVKYYLEEEYKKEEKWKFDYVIDKNTIPKLVIAEDEIITNYKRKKVYYTFLTNIDFENQESYIKMYKKRWNIKTRFRMLKDAVIKTKSTSLKVRLFLFMLKCVIHNLWIKIRNKKECISLKFFIVEICKLLNEFDYSIMVMRNTPLCIPMHIRRYW